MSSPKNEALSIPEILETILLQLPIRDLLVNAQLVCHAWHDATKSPNIQQALFFQPLPEKEGQTPAFNPLLQQAFKPWFTPRHSSRASRKKDSHFKNLEWNTSQEKQKAFSRAKASWRRMLPVQPPATIFQVQAERHAMRGTSSQRGKVEFNDGVRMGTLYDYAYKTVTMPISYFWIDWDMDPSSCTHMKENEVFEMRRKVTMYTDYTVQCKRPRILRLGSELKSQGYENLEIRFDEQVLEQCLHEISKCFVIRCHVLKSD